MARVELELLIKQLKCDSLAMELAVDPLPIGLGILGTSLRVNGLKQFVVAELKQLDSGFAGKRRRHKDSAD